MIRKESYEMFIIPSLEKMILVCDEEGNSTFIINRLSETPHFYYSLSKDQLKALKDSELIDQIDWRNLDKWKEDLLNSLTKPKQSNYEQLTEDEIKKILENIKQKFAYQKKKNQKIFYLLMKLKN